MKFLKVLGIAATLLGSVSAQFGVPNKKKTVGSSFEQLNEMMKEEQDSGGGLKNLQQRILEMQQNPEVMRSLEAMGDAMAEAVKEMEKMSPEQLRSQMKEAMNMLFDNDGNFMEKIVANREEVLKNLEVTGLVKPEELERYQSDPAYFEEHMKEAFSQMQDIFTRPELIEEGIGSILSGVEAAANDPTVKEIQKLMMQKEDPTDVEIEEIRLKLLQAAKDDEEPKMAPMFGLEEFKKAIEDADEFKKSFLEGRQALHEFAEMTKPSNKEGAGMGEGAGVGEL